MGRLQAKDTNTGKPSPAPLLIPPKQGASIDSAEALELALQKGREKSNANRADASFPQNFGQPNADGSRPAEGWTTDKPYTGMAHSLESTGFGNMGGNTAFAAGMDMELARNMEQFNNPGRAQQARKEAQERLAGQAPEPPTQVAVGNSITLLPPSLRRVPRDLHQNDSISAMRLFKTFCGGKQNMVSKLASRGHAAQPFCYLTQALWCLLEMNKFQLKPRMVPEVDAYDEPTGNMVRKIGKDGNVLDPEFNPQIEGSINGIIQQDLRSWAGDELANVITDRCYRANISVMCGLKRCYAELERQRVAEIETAQKCQTSYQWTTTEDDEVDE